MDVIVAADEAEFLIFFLCIHNSGGYGCRYDDQEDKNFEAFERRTRNPTTALVFLFGLRRFAHGLLEPANAFPQAFAELGKLLGTEGHHRDNQDDQQMHGLK